MTESTEKKEALKGIITPGRVFKREIRGGGEKPFAGTRGGGRFTI